MFAVSSVDEALGAETLKKKDMEAYLVVYTIGEGFKIIDAVEPLHDKGYLNFYFSPFVRDFVWHTNLSPKSEYFNTLNIRSIWRYKAYLEDLRKHYSITKQNGKQEFMRQRVASLSRYVSTLDV